MNEKTFSGKDLEKALATGELEQQSVALLTGMTKKSELDGHVGFTPAGCDAWIDLPVELIQQAEYLGQARCKDHTHPVFRISIREAASPVAAAALLKIVASLSTRVTQQSVSPQFAQANPGISGMNSPMNNQRLAGAPNHPGQSFGGGQQSPPVIARQFGGGPWAGGAGGGLNAWGCWDSTCADCILWDYVCNGTACWWLCKIWTERPCERCIWPW